MLNFIRREKIYIWMLFFIVAVNLINISHPEKKPAEGKDYISTKTFKELGITEEKVSLFLESKSKEARFFRFAIWVATLFILIGFLLNFIFFIHRKNELLKLKPKHLFPVSWGLLDVIRAGIIIVFIGYILSMVEAFILKAYSLKMDMNLRMIVSTFFIDLTAGVVILYFVLVKYKKGIWDIGLRFQSFFKDILSGITAYIFIVPILIVVMLISLWILSILGYQPPPQPVLEVFIEEERSRVLLFLTVFVSVWGPILEEMFFRGFMYPAIKKRVGIFWGVLISGGIFSMLHTNIVGFLPIMVLGMVLAYLYEASSSLLPSITLHVLHNSIMVGFVYFIKELLR